MTWQHIEDACRAACEQIGVIYRSVPADGEFYTADLADDPRGRGDGRIKLFPDGKGGIVQNWKTGEKQAFFIDRQAGAALSPADREHIKAEQERRRREQQAKHDRAARRARSIWQVAKSAPPDHPYLARKRIKPHLARVTTWRRIHQDASGGRQKLAIENALIIPLINETGAYRNLQAIFPAASPALGRDKDFLPGGALAGLFWWIGQEKTDPVLIAEGFATAATLHQETGYRVYIAFSAGNLLAVGRIIRKHLPAVKIIFAADNDAKTAGNPGLTQAHAAAAVVDGFVIVPPMAGDFNDFAAHLQGAA
ncbi:toprim domain-containing protein [Methylomicrobium sp. Wu6]|uniref:toprim domain-containing protein n=1 Tax=Methylomicrobium sp. Wu6 TaxID=3107928 RepID=UPI002DD670BD|nr:toprim domain-containing protein [Methylomicrobium sp. Wu6]MEC4747961.1 toprim domain-containing protein [Methylomicrobium sp. Wu6]